MRYKSISDYAAIGNLRTIALIDRTGSIDWCCYPELDDDSVFAAILDKEIGGHFRIQPENAEAKNQEYIEDSFAVATRFDAEEGKTCTYRFHAYNRGL
jgi:alpha,alpha-trehalase